jgi:hypothetical protein
MKTIAQFSPYDYVGKLMDVHVPGYEGYPGGQVSISQYLSANSMFGGNSKAAVLNAAFNRIVHAHNETAVTSQTGFARVFTGQGSRSNFAAAMSIINRYSDEFRAVRDLAKYFQAQDFLQAMVDDHCFGLDCIGFVGTYLVEASLEDNYVGRRPLDYTAVFKPVKSLDEVTDCSVVMLTNGMHVQIIDTVNERGNGYITVDLCQSTSGGPQCNLGVTIRSGGGDYLPVETFRQALASRQYSEQHAADNAQRQNEGKPPRDYETYLRALLTKHNTAFGFAGGAIFTITGTGEPRNPVSGSVYIGVAPGGVSVRVP